MRYGNGDAIRSQRSTTLKFDIYSREALTTQFPSSLHTRAPIIILSLFCQYFSPAQIRPKHLIGIACKRQKGDDSRRRRKKRAAVDRKSIATKYKMMSINCAWSLSTTTYLIYLSTDGLWLFVWRRSFEMLQRAMSKVYRDIMQMNCHSLIVTSTTKTINLFEKITNSQKMTRKPRAISNHANHLDTMETRSSSQLFPSSRLHFLLRGG